MKNGGDRHSKDSLAVHFARLKEVNNVETRDKIAKEFHMSSSTVQRNEKYAGAIMNISKNTGLSLEKVIEVQRKSRSSKENIEELATLKPDEQKTIVKKIADANPGIVNLRCEILDVRPMFTPEQLKEIAKREASEPLISCSYVPHPLIDRLAICPCGCGYGVEASFVKKWYSKEEYDGVIR